MATEFIPAQDMKVKRGGDEGDLEALLTTHADRLGVDKERAMANAIDFADIVGLVESGGNPTAKNIPQQGKEASSASGTYQFIQDSVEPAVNRLKKYIGMKDWMKSALMHKDASRLSPSQQTLLFLGDLLEKDGSDKYMKGILESGDMMDMENAYMNLHHTKPDQATIRNWNRKVYNGKL